ncbi:polymer-forming cytoskeletal protein, partial [Acidobacteria bacterium AH-259-L09]|nr:polymer-forming cytoskeletal protein [Acidobacteria bacterium AH-259-L09]
LQECDTMWKKPETEGAEFPSSIPRKNPVEQLKDRAIIGPSISIKGELTGEEDLLIQGRVEGKIKLKKNNITVGKKGRIKANIYGKIISIEGEVEGDLFGVEKIVLRQSGVVRGNITAPRVNLEDGAKFKGSIDMDSEGGERQPTLSEAVPQAKSSPAKVAPQNKELHKKDTPQSRKIGVGIRVSTPSSRA